MGTLGNLIDLKRNMLETETKFVYLMDKAVAADKRGEGSLMLWQEVHTCKATLDQIRLSYMVALEKSHSMRSELRRVA